MIRSGAEFDDYATGYAQDVERAVAFSGKDHAFFLRAKAEYLNESLSRRGIVPSDCDLLDIGCGIGRFHRYLREFGSVTGIDESEAMLVRARADNPTVRYLGSDARLLPLSDESFDVVLAINVFHHVLPSDRPGMIREMARVCRSGGFVVLMEHNPLHPLTRYVTSRCPCDRDARLLGRSETTALLEKSAGLEEIEVGYLLFVPSERRLARFLERSLRRVPAGAQYCAIGRRQPTSAGS